MPCSVTSECWIWIPWTKYRVAMSHGWDRLYLQVRWNNNETHIAEVAMHKLSQNHVRNTNVVRGIQILHSLVTGRGKVPDIIQFKLSNYFKCTSWSEWNPLLYQCVFYTFSRQLVFHKTKCSTNFYHITVLEYSNWV